MNIFTKFINLSMVKISKKYIPKETEKYMCAKHLAYFKQKLIEWKKDLKKYVFNLLNKNYKLKNISEKDHIENIINVKIENKQDGINFSKETKKLKKNILHSFDLYLFV